VERLDVNGNINVAGTIKANGVDGQPNQVLMKDQSGAFVWGDLCNYKNQAYFDAVTTQNWAVPANVQRISIEAWGSGGGGSSYSGGGGGGYIVATFAVTPGEIISITINFGGNGGNGNTAGTAGGNTIITVDDTTVTAHGGNGGTAGSQIPTTTGGYYSVTNGFSNFFAVRGEAGHGCEYMFTNNGTNALEIVFNGNGGNAGNTNSTGALGAYRIVFTGSPSSTVRYRLPEVGRQPGGGGGAGFSMISGTSTNNGFAGGSGAVVIHY
jgi:MSHA biogenesis protein MshQ